MSALPCRDCGHSENDHDGYGGLCDGLGFNGSRMICDCRGYAAPAPDAPAARQRHPSETWWLAATWKAPFTPGYHTGGNDGKVRDATGAVVADCFGWESRADVIADLLNLAAASPSRAAR